MSRVEFDSLWRGGLARLEESKHHKITEDEKEEIKALISEASSTAWDCANQLGGVDLRKSFSTPLVIFDQRTVDGIGEVRLGAKLKFTSPQIGKRIISPNTRFNEISYYLIPSNSNGYTGLVEEQCSDGLIVNCLLVSKRFINFIDNIADAKTVLEVTRKIRHNV